MNVRINLTATLICWALQSGSLALDKVVAKLRCD